MRTRRQGGLFVLIVVASTATAYAADQTPQRRLDTKGSKPRMQERQKTNPAMASIEDEPGLPRVLLVGDSISIGYTLPTRDLLKGRANVHRIPTNGGPTSKGLEGIDSWLGDGKWDVIHFNWGLHDIRYMDNGEKQVSPEDYDKNLRELVEKMKASGATLIWAATTPFPQGVTPKRVPEECVEYNRIAEKIMKDNDIMIDDLYSYALPHLKEWQLPQNVHFTPDGSKELAKQVAATIEKALEQRKKSK